MAAASPIGSSSASNHAREQVGHVGGDLDLVQPDAVLAGQLAGVGQVVGHGLQAPVLGPERDRVAVDVAVMAGGQDGEQAGVQPAGQEGGDGHVGHQVRGDRVLQHAAQLLHVNLPAGRRGELGARVEEPPVPPVAVRADLQPGPRRELVDALVDAVVLGDPVVHQGGDDGGRVDRRALPEQRPQALELRGEGHATVPRRPEQRLDAELVAGEGERAVALVVQREREHAPQAPQARRAPPPPGLQQHLGVGAGAEADPGVAQLGPQLAVVVDLAAEHEHQPVLHERLVGRGRQVDDRQATVPEPHPFGVVGAGPGAGRVRPAVGEGVGHGGPPAGVDREVVGPQDPAHSSGRDRAPPPPHLSAPLAR